MRSFDRIMLAAIFASGWIETGTGIGSGAMAVGGCPDERIARAV